jgi:heptosyltransferase-3
MRILFISANRLGDAVLSTGLIDQLHAQFPKARFTVVAGPAAAGVFEAVPNLDRLIVMRKLSWGRHWWELWKQLVLTRFWLTIDLRGSGIGQFLLARRRRTFHGSGSRLHKVLVLGNFLKLKVPPAPRVWIADHHAKAAFALWSDDGRPVLALGPTANWGGKIWPPERFAELALRLTDATTGILPNARIAVFGGPGEEALAQPVIAALPPDRVIDLVGKLDLLTISAALRRCALYIGNDSGLMHLAAASGTLTLGLFGPSRESVYGPWGEKNNAVRTDLSYEEILAQPGYDYTSHQSHMLTLSVDKAQKAAEDMWHLAQDD